MRKLIIKYEYEMDCDECDCCGNLFSSKERVYVNGNVVWHNINDGHMHIEKSNHSILDGILSQLEKDYVEYFSNFMSLKLFNDSIVEIRKACLYLPYQECHQLGIICILIEDILEVATAYISNSRHIDYLNLKDEKGNDLFAGDEVQLYGLSNFIGHIVYKDGIYYVVNQFYSLSLESLTNNKIISIDEGKVFGLIKQIY